MSLGSARLVVSGTRAVYGRYPNKVLLEQAPEGYEEIQTKVRRATCWRPSLDLGYVPRARLSLADLWSRNTLKSSGG